MKFSQKMPLNASYTMVQKSQKWPKTQIKGVLPYTEWCVLSACCALVLHWTRHSPRPVRMKWLMLAIFSCRSAFCCALFANCFSMPLIFVATLRTVCRYNQRRTRFATNHTCKSMVCWNFSIQTITVELTFWFLQAITWSSSALFSFFFLFKRRFHFCKHHWPLGPVYTKRMWMPQTQRSILFFAHGAFHWYSETLTWSLRKTTIKQGSTWLMIRLWPILPDFFLPFSALSIAQKNRKTLPKILLIERNSAQILLMEGNSGQILLAKNVPALSDHTVTFETTTWITVRV